MGNPQAFDCRPCRGVRSVDLTWVEWGALARSIDKILTMEELKEKSPLYDAYKPKKKQKKKNKKKTTTTRKTAAPKKK